MIRKISGKNKSPSYTHLNMVGTDSKATSKTDFADTLGETFCHNSSSFNYSESFRKIKTEQEKVKLNFKSQNNKIYNKDFNLDELVEARVLMRSTIKCLNISQIFLLKLFWIYLITFGLLVNFQKIGP